MSTTETTKGQPQGFAANAANYLDERTKLGGGVKFIGRKIFPDHWSFMLG